MPDYLSRITIRADQCNAHPCIRGMRLRVADILEMLAGGMAEEQILTDYPYLEARDIRAALAYAARELSRSGVPEGQH